MMTKVTKASVDARVRDWMRRLNALYSQLDQWLPDRSNLRVIKEPLNQVIEPLMSQFKVPPRQIPTYTILIGKVRIAFVPSALWIVGANGRVNITTNRRQHILVDVGDETENASNWQLVIPNDRASLKPFDKVAFDALLEEGR